jgi:hypothetical protein
MTRQSHRRRQRQLQHDVAWKAENQRRYHGDLFQQRRSVRTNREYIAASLKGEAIAATKQLSTTSKAPAYSGMYQQHIAPA